MKKSQIWRKLYSFLTLGSWSNIRLCWDLCSSERSTENAIIEDRVAGGVEQVLKLAVEHSERHCDVVSSSVGSARRVVLDVRNSYAGRRRVGRQHDWSNVRLVWSRQHSGPFLHERREEPTELLVLKWWENKILKKI